MFLAPTPPFHNQTNFSESSSYQDIFCRCVAEQNPAYFKRNRLIRLVTKSLTLSRPTPDSHSPPFRIASMLQAVFSAAENVRSAPSCDRCQKGQQTVCVENRLRLLKPTARKKPVRNDARYEFSPATVLSSDGQALRHRADHPLKTPWCHSRNSRAGRALSSRGTTWRGWLSSA